MKPTDKHPELEALFEELNKRSSSVRANICVVRPIGCGQPITGFRDDVSEREYRISGLCQNCQDKMFGVKEDK